MGLAFAKMTDTKLGNDSLTLIFHTEGCQRGSHLEIMPYQTKKQTGIKPEHIAGDDTKIKVICSVLKWCVLFGVCNICLSQQREQES